MNQVYQQNNITYIDDLPELEDLERAPQSALRNNKNYKYQSSDVLPPGEEHKFQKFIRNGHSTPIEAGMQQSFNNNNLLESPNISVSNISVPNIKENTEQFHGKTYNMPENSPSCIDFYEHVSNCPICSKYYNNDKTVYIIAIIALSIIVMLLLKRVLDV
jgi:hypothetical protein